MSFMAAGDGSICIEPGKLLSTPSSSARLCVTSTSASLRTVSSAPVMTWGMANDPRFGVPSMMRRPPFAQRSACRKM